MPYMEDLQMSRERNRKKGGKSNCICSEMNPAGTLITRGVMEMENEMLQQGAAILDAEIKRRKTKRQEDIVWEDRRCAYGQGVRATEETWQMLVPQHMVCRWKSETRMPQPEASRMSIKAT